MSLAARRSRSVIVFALACVLPTAVAAQIAEPAGARMGTVFSVAMPSELQPSSQLPRIKRHRLRPMAIGAVAGVVLGGGLMYAYVRANCETCDDPSPLRMATGMGALMGAAVGALAGAGIADLRQRPRAMGMRPSNSLNLTGMAPGDRLEIRPASRPASW